MDADILITEHGVVIPNATKCHMVKSTNRSFNSEKATPSEEEIDKGTRKVEQSHIDQKVWHVNDSFTTIVNYLHNPYSL